jgi:hypothetical protein
MISDLTILLNDADEAEKSFINYVDEYKGKKQKSEEDYNSYIKHRDEYKQYHLTKLEEYVNKKYDTFADMNNDDYHDLVFASFLVYYVLTKPFYDESKVKLNNLIFDGNNANIKSFVTDYDIEWSFYDEENIKKIAGIDKSSMELMKQTYERYFKIKELFDSNEILKLLNNYSTYIDDFIRIQPVANLQKYLSNLNGIYTGLYSDKTESYAYELKNKITNLIVGELDNFVRGNQLDKNKFIYISRYIALDDIFFPFIASYTEIEFIDLKQKISNLSTSTLLPKLFNDQLDKAKVKYTENHKLYLEKVDGKIKDLQSKLEIDDYGLIKVLLTTANKLTKELQMSYTRFLQISNIYDKDGKDKFKTELKERVALIQTLYKKIVEKEAFLKDKEFNSTQNKDHQFTLGIELLTNVQGNEKLKYTPNMTIPSGGGDAIYFTTKRPMHQNVIKNIPPDKSPEYKYVQLTKLPDFNSLLTRLSSGYLLEAETPFDEYSKVYKKKNDELTNSNIEIVLNTLFDTGSPFYIGSNRYTSFSYGWENGVEKITKNDKKETYGDEDDNVINGLTKPNSIQWQNLFGTGATGVSGLSRPPISSFSSEADEVGLISEEHKSDELTHGTISNLDEENEVGTIIATPDTLTRVNPIVADSETDEAGSIIATPDTLTHKIPIVADSETDEVGTIIATPDTLTRVNPIVADSETDEVSTIIATPDTLTRVNHIVADSETDEVGSIIATPDTLTRVNPIVADSETDEASAKNSEKVSLSPITPIILARDNQIKDKSEEYETGTLNPTKSDDNVDDKSKNKNTDYQKNSEYMKRLMEGTPLPETKYQDKFLKLLRLEQNMDVNSINFTSILDEPIYSNQVGGANALYIDLDEETILYSQKKKELENEIKKQQEDELALLSKQNEDLNKDESIQEVKWKYFITVELQLYPGDHIPLSAYASLACSKKSNDIYNIWQNIITKIKNPNSKEKYKKQMIAYVPVIPNKTIKNKETPESTTKNNTVKVRDTKNIPNP